MDNKILFILGAGASIASSNQDLLEVLGPLSMPNLIIMMRKMSEMNNNNDELKLIRRENFDFKKCGDIFINKYNDIEEIYEKLKNLEEKDIPKIFQLLKPDYKKVLNREENISFSHLKFIKLMYQTVSAYYQCSESKYFEKLFDIVTKNSSTIISLNWDINFEKVIKNKTKVAMKNYYGKTVFNHLSDNNKKDNINPIVKILKPHGSLNMYFNDDKLGYEAPGFAGNLPESKYHLFVSDHVNQNVDFPGIYLLIPPIHESEIPELNDKDIKNKFKKYGIRKINILKGLRKEIKEVISCTDVLIIIGYSFPELDNHIYELFKDHSISRIIVLDKKEDVFDRITNHPLFKKIKIKEFKKNGFEDIVNFEKWI
jgi:hypothetical protein